MSAGLLLARAYAVTDHKRLVLAILSILGICAVVTELVCTHSFLWLACDGHLSQVNAGSDSCNLTSVQLQTFINVSSTYAHVNYTQYPSEVNTWKSYSLLIDCVFSRWHQYNCCHIVWHYCGCCDTQRHTGNMESLQTINMEQADTHTFNSWTKYVIISVAG